MQPDNADATERAYQDAARLLGIPIEALKARAARNVELRQQIEHGEEPPRAMPWVAGPPDGRRYVLCHGKVTALSDIARQHGVTPSAAYRRVASGWTVADAVTRPGTARPEKPPRVDRRKLFDWRGERRTLTDLARKHGLNPATVNGRLALGWDLARALTTPAGKRGTRHGS